MSANFPNRKRLSSRISLFLYTLFIFVICIQCVQAANTYNFVKQWGSSGSDIAIDQSGNIYIADFMGNMIQKVTSDGVPLIPWGLGTNQFTGPRGIAVDSGGNVYSTDYLSNRVQKFNSDGIYLMQWGTNGSGDGQFYLPRSIAVDSGANVYVADSGNHRVQKFTSDGTFVTKWDVFSWPSTSDSLRDIAVDTGGNVYVVDYFGNRIQKFNSDGTDGRQWGLSGSGSDDGKYQFAEGIAVDAEGNVYVVDNNNSRIQKFTSNGTFVTKWGSFGNDPGQFKYPTGIAVDTKGNIYVADHGNYRIQMFSPSRTPVITITQRPSIIFAGFTASPVQGSSPLTVQFNDTSTSNNSEISAWSWDFGDGTTSLVRSPSHTYTIAKNYTVILNVANADRTEIMIKPRFIMVSAPPTSVPTSVVTSPPPATKPTPNPIKQQLSLLTAVVSVGVVCLLHMVMRRK
jgi:PKD repeat protein